MPYGSVHVHRGDSPLYLQTYSGVNGGHRGTAEPTPTKEAQLRRHMKMALFQVIPVVMLVGHGRSTSEVGIMKNTTHATKRALVSIATTVALVSTVGAPFKWSMMIIWPPFL